MTTQFYPLTDIWVLSYTSPDTHPGTLVVSKPIGVGDSSVLATSLVVPTSGVYGLRMRNGSETVRLYLGEYLADMPAGSIHVDLPTANVMLALNYDDTTKAVTASYSLDGLTWTVQDAVAMASRPTFGDLYFDQFSTIESISASFLNFRVLAGTTALPYPEKHVFFSPIGGDDTSQPPALTPTQENVIHALVGAQFGDLEFDIGKSVRWTQYFVDDVFITDVNYGDPRYWIIDWAKTFPYVNYQTAGGGVSFFDDPVAFRKQQFADAEKFAFDNDDALVFDNDDWVMWVDAHEGLSVDNTPPFPDDYDFDLFRSYVAREIRVAIEAGKDRIKLPFFVYVRHDNIQNVEYDWIPNQPEGGNKCVQSMGVPYYIPYQGLVRLMKVSALRNPSFNWASIDQPSAPDAGVRIQTVSYGYAHWNLQDIVPPATGVPALNAENDLGWRQRNLISKVRPVVGLPYGDTWQFPNADVPGLAGPWAPDTFETQVTGVVIPEARPPIDLACAGVRVPLYDSVLRLNTRDGVWYSGDGSGNVPLEWDDESQSWKPPVPQEQQLT